MGQPYFSGTGLPMLIWSQAWLRGRLRWEISCCISGRLRGSLPLWGISPTTWTGFIRRILKWMICGPFLMRPKRGQRKKRLSRLRAAGPGQGKRRKKQTPAPGLTLKMSPFPMESPAAPPILGQKISTKKIRLSRIGSLCLRILPCISGAGKGLPLWGWMEQEKQLW